MPAESIQRLVGFMPDKSASRAVTNAFKRFIGVKADAAPTPTVVLKPTRIFSAEGTPTSVSTAGADTITAAMILTGIYVRNTNGLARTDTFSTAALLVAAIPDAAIGDVIRLLVINGAGAAETLTLAAGVGGAFDANQIAASRVIAQNSSKVVHIRLTAVATGSEAYVIYA